MFKKLLISVGILLFLSSCNVKKEDQFLDSLFQKNGEICDPSSGEICEEVEIDECLEYDDEYEAMMEKGLKAKSVTANSLNVRSCNSSDCGILGSEKKSKIVYIYEEKDGWLRISNPYSAKCNSENKTPLVKIGNNLCKIENGIENGMIAKWVHGAYVKDIELKTDTHKDKHEDKHEDHHDDDHHSEE